MIFNCILLTDGIINFWTWNLINKIIFYNKDFSLRFPWNDISKFIVSFSFCVHDHNTIKQVIVNKLFKFLI